MIKTFKYRLVPTRKQQAALQTLLDSCRFLYNCALEQRKMRRIGQFAQMREVTEVRAAFPEYQGVHVHILQNVIKKLDRAFQGFFRRIKHGQKAGFPRFKGKDRFDSFAFNNTGFKLAGRYLQISKIGAVKLRLSRPLPEGSAVKSLVVKRSGQNWYACLAVEFSPVHLPHSDARVGIDVGVVQYATFSDGSSPIENPRFYENAQAELRRSQRRVARRKRGSHRRRKAVALLRKLHERIANKRNDFLHKQTTALIRKYGTIGVENLNIAGMVQGNCSKQILDASWGTWLRMLVFKAEEAGRRIVAVDPRFTSQTCPCCGYKDAKNRPTQAEFKCLDCGFEANADFIASVNISARIEPSGVNVGRLSPCVA
jgi:putative transposase